MSDAEQRLTADRANRAAARGLFDRRLARVRQDLAARSVPARAGVRVREEAFRVLDHGIDVAKESKGIIAATTGALALWLLRAPLFGWMQEHLGQAAVDEDEDIGQIKEQDA